MNLQERIEALETEFNEKIKTLKAEAQREQEFPQVGEEYWFITDRGMVFDSKFENKKSDRDSLKIGNIFQTREEAEFQVEKLRVEAEFRKFSRPFKEDEYNYFMKIDSTYNTIVVYAEKCQQTQGVIYFESAKIANEATDTVGEERIKKYIFGEEG